MNAEYVHRLVVGIREAETEKAAIEFALSKMARISPQPFNPHLIYDKAFWQSHRERENYEIFYDQLIYAEANGSSCILHLHDQADEHVMRSSNLTELMKTCNDARFFLINRSMLINLHHVRRVDRWVRTLTLTYNTVVPVSRHMHATLLRELKEQLHYHH